jgi:hypothetical protein
MYTARKGTAPIKFSEKGLASWSYSGGSSNFNFTTGASKTHPPGCSLSISHKGISTVLGFYNTESGSVAQCGGREGHQRVSGDFTTHSSTGDKVQVALALDAASGNVTMTLSGPADVWWGVGFGAAAMSSEPWTLVVDGTGTVTEHKLGNHAPGTVLQPSISVVSSAVQDGVRTVVVTRDLKIDRSYFEDDYYVS